MMTHQQALSSYSIAISISDSQDLLALGLSAEHLRDAMTEVARHLLALGARLVYGGDLRHDGFSKLLFELVARHSRYTTESDKRAAVINYLAWPVHISKEFSFIEQALEDLENTAELVCLGISGDRISMDDRQQYLPMQLTCEDWSVGLTTMRKLILETTQARIVLGGQVDQYKGIMPGIAEEALMSLRAKQPLFLLGGFGGCTRDIVESLNLASSNSDSFYFWNGCDCFRAFTMNDLNNGLSYAENMVLATTPHIDEAILLVLKGLIKLLNRNFVE